MFAWARIDRGESLWAWRQPFQGCQVEESLSITSKRSRDSPEYREQEDEALRQDCDATHTGPGRDPKFVWLLSLGYSSQSLFPLV